MSCHGAYRTHPTAYGVYIQVSLRGIFGTQPFLKIVTPSTQKTVLVLLTGCSAGGIGNALALEFHARGEFKSPSNSKQVSNYIIGLHFIATARRSQAMENLAKAGITTSIIDVTALESVARAKDDVAKLTGGTLDILANNP